MTGPRNPNGIGGFKPGQSGNPGGRPQSSSAIQLLALRYCREAIELLAKMMSDENKKIDPTRVAVIREILDRGVGKPVAAINLDLTLTKRLEEMSPDELLAFRERYAALVSAEPALIEHLMEGDERAEQQEIFAGDA